MVMIFEQIFLLCRARVLWLLVSALALSLTEALFNAQRDLYQNCFTISSYPREQRFVPSPASSLEHWLWDTLET